MRVVFFRAYGRPSRGCTHDAIGGGSIHAWGNNVLLLWGWPYDQPQPTLSSYDAELDEWIGLLPLTRQFNPDALVWTGNELLAHGHFVLTGADRNALLRIVLDDRSWSESSALGAPGSRATASVGTKFGVWTGTELLVWGKADAEAGAPRAALYDPDLDQWRSMTEQGAPSLRSGESLVWTGTELIVWGGASIVDPAADGYRFAP